MADSVDDGLAPGEGDTALSSAELAQGAIIGDPSRVVTARGTEDGLILRIDGRANWPLIIGDIESFLGGRRKFFEGGEVSVEWLERLPTKEQSKELEDLLREQYGIEIVTRRKRPPRLGKVMEEAGTKPSKPGTAGGSPSTALSGTVLPGTGGSASTAASNANSGVTIPLFDEITAQRSAFELGSQSGLLSHSLSEEIEKLSMSSPSFTGGSSRSSAAASSEQSENLGKKYGSRMAKLLGEELFYEDDANAKVVFGTLRSGQRVETPFSLIIVGDVNPGADLTAGGDIIVLGSLRGTAHASAYDDDSFDSVIIALQMQPMQLRIGSVISRGSDEKVRGAEIARIENRRIIVEQFNPKALLNSKSLSARRSR